MGIALITGGSRGIGEALVNTFKRAGHKVATCALSLKSLEHSVADYKFACDVSDGEQVKLEIQKIASHFSKIDFLICNAGIAPANSLDPNGTDDVWGRVIDVNLNGSYYFTKFCAPFIKDNGRVIHLGSISSLYGSERLSAYSVSKHAIIGLTRSFAKLLAPRGITVNSICPGFVKTDMIEEYLRETKVDEVSLIKKIPSRRLILPEEVSEAALYLCSANACSITGQALIMDGGLSL